MHEPFFFLHIPRTAGTTLNSILKNNFPPEEILSIYDKDDYEKNRYQSVGFLESITLIIGHLLLESTNPPTFYGMPVRVFTFLREPIARLASEYDFLRSWEANHLYTFLHENKVSFREYIRSQERCLFYRGKNFMTRCISGKNFMDEPYPEEALEYAKETLEKSFTFFGIQERFFESLVMLADILGLNNILHEKRNALKGEARTCLDEEDIALARQKNAADMELYAFALELFDKRIAALGPAFQERIKKLSILNEQYQKVSQLLMQRAEQSEQGHILLPKDGMW
jgi:hypothetical protein